MATGRAWPDIAIPPGDVLEETLAAQGMTQAELARRAGRPLQAINQIVQGTKGITAETALQFERVLGTPAHVWVRLEADYRYTLALINDRKSLARQAREAKKYPYAKMAELGWVPKAKEPSEKAKHLMTFFGVASLEHVGQAQPAAFRRSARVKACPNALAAWLRQGERQAQEAKVRPFDGEALSEALAEVRAMTMQEPGGFHPRLTRLLADCGVAFVVVHHLPKTGAHGATRWLAKKAVMQVSIRYRWADIFWFTVFHEVAHLLKHGRKEVFVEYDQRSGDDAEREADTFAAEVLIPPRDYASFRRSTGARPSAQEVLAFARSLGIAPGIVVGRLHYDQVVPHNHLNNLRLRFVLAADENET